MSDETTKAASDAANEAKAALAFKKESFQWSTPADEFADDVGSSEDEGDDDDDPDYNEDESRGNNGETSCIVIDLGVDEAGKYSVSRGGGDDVQRSGDSYNGDKSLGGSKKMKKQQFKCQYCPKVWTWPWELRRHVTTHYKEKERAMTSVFKCDECGRGFQWKRDLAQHKRLHTGEKLLVCSVCEKKFTTRQALLHHVVVHTGELPFQCALCGNRFTQPANLRTHVKKKHADSNMKGNKCPHCGEVFPSIIAVHQHVLEDHQNIVAEEREEQQAEKVRRQHERAERERVREERRKGREERRKERFDYNNFRVKGLHEWEINYEFHIGEGLVRGVDWDRTPSSGELSCELCERKFGWRYEMMFHALCHKTDEDGNPKNRVCPECDTQFKVPIGLKHHLLIHTMELPFLCLHCWRSFSSHIDLKLHIRKEHLFHLEPSVTDSKGAADKKARPVRAKAEAAFGRGQRAAKRPAEESYHEVQVVMSQDGLEGSEGQTILVGSDGTIMHTSEHDMIVVIQSDDFDQSEGGVIVVDPSQLQHVVGSDGMPITLLQTHDGMIVTSEGETVGQAMAQAENGEAAHDQAVEAVAEAKIIVPDGPQMAGMASSAEESIAEPEGDVEQPGAADNTVSV